MGLFDLTFLKDWVALVFWLFVGIAVQLGTGASYTVSVSDEQGQSTEA